MTTISCHLSQSLAPKLQRVSDSFDAYLLGSAGAIATAVQVPHRAAGAAAAAAMEATYPPHVHAFGFDTSFTCLNWSIEEITGVRHSVVEQSMKQHGKLSDTQDVVTKCFSYFQGIRIIIDQFARA